MTTVSGSEGSRRRLRPVPQGSEGRGVGQMPSNKTPPGPNWEGLFLGAALLLAAGVIIAFVIQS
jgi:hypothetical protein